MTALLRAIVMCFKDTDHSKLTSHCEVKSILWCSQSHFDRQNHMRHKEKPISSDRLGKQKGRGVRRRYPARRRKRIE
ncbi:hypothetical protein AAC387_Pa08g0804 [Persea americana]